MAIRRWPLSHYYMRMRPSRVPLTTFAFDLARYVFAERFVRDKSVLDAATGKGYGAYHLAKVGRAKRVVGVDLDEESVRYARRMHRHPNLRFERMDVACMGFSRSSFEVVVSFETLEHIVPEKTAVFMGEVLRVLKPEGVFVISTPNRPVYSAISRTRDHINEMDSRELRSLLSCYFSECRFYYQGRNLPHREQKGKPASRTLTALAMVSRHLPRLSIALAESATGRWAAEKRLERLMSDRRVVAASSLDDVGSCLFQLAVCRDPRKSCCESM